MIYLVLLLLNSIVNKYQLETAANEPGLQYVILRHPVRPSSP